MYSCTPPRAHYALALGWKGYISFGDKGMADAQNCQKRVDCFRSTLTASRRMQGAGKLDNIYLLKQRTADTKHKGAIVIWGVDSVTDAPCA